MYVPLGILTSIRIDKEDNSIHSSCIMIARPGKVLGTFMTCYLHIICHPAKEYIKYQNIRGTGTVPFEVTAPFYLPSIGPKIEIK